jgi:polyisoprenyl-phosphate glycosyltransferase
VGVVRLRSNVGHQRAIAIGLSFLHGWVRPDAAVVVMDADGEDDPADVPRLLEALARQPGHIVVANRARRSESLGFRIGYGLYRAAYRALTGHAIRSGNFCAMRGASVRRLAYIPSLWNHLAATIYKSRLPVAGIEVARGRRYAGQSRMNLIDLMVHGLSAISVHMEAAGVRVLVLALGFSATALAAGLFVVHRRLFTDLAIPGWASVLSTLFILLAAVGLSAALTLVFLVLSARDRRPVIPAVDGHYWVEGVERLG